jgi:hypothetical protein
MTRVDEIEAAILALAEQGHWIGHESPDAELIRVEVRRAARKAKINVRTVVDARGRPHAFTPDGLPAHEPLRGAVIHAEESGAMGALAVDAMERWSRRDGRPDVMHTAGKQAARDSSN